MSKEREFAGSAPDATAEGPSPQNEGYGRKALVFFLGAAGFTLALKLPLGS